MALLINRCLLDDHNNSVTSSGRIYSRWIINLASSDGSQLADAIVKGNNYAIKILRWREHARTLRATGNKINVVKINVCHERKASLCITSYHIVSLYNVKANSEQPEISYIMEAIRENIYAKNY